MAERFEPVGPDVTATSGSARSGDRGAYRNQARPTSRSSGTGPYRRESIGSPNPAAAVSAAVASLTQPGLVVGQLEVAVRERDALAGAGGRPA